MKPTWKKYLLHGSVIVVGGILLFLLEETIRLKNTGFRGKTLWDWMELLVIPAVLAGGALFLERSERAVDRKTAVDRANLNRELATDRQQEAALQAYLDRMADLLLKKNLRRTENEEVRNVARIRTLTVLRGLDGRRKGLVVRFLYESGLIAQPSVVDMTGADLSRAELIGAELIGTNLALANFRKANLRGANLSGAELIGANLSRTNLYKAYLLKTDLQEANLSNANLERANLERANLILANLSKADLSGANFCEANLEGVLVTDEQLAAAQLLKGATMPDGTIHDQS